MKTRIFALAQATVLILALCGCSAQMNSAAQVPQTADTYGFSQNGVYRDTMDGAGKYDMAADEPAEYDALTSDIVPEDAVITNTSVVFDPDRKLIRNASIEAETTGFEEAVEGIEELIAECGGYVESSSVAGNKRFLKYGDMRDASFTVRVPSNNFDLFLRQMETLANVYSVKSDTKDATEQYIDTESRLNALKIMEERLLEMLSKATVLNDVVSLERTLADNRYEIERLTGSLRKIDSLAAFSSISIQLEEVLEITENEELSAPPKTLWERIAVNFADTSEGVWFGFEDFLVFFLGGAPVLLIWIIALGVIALIVFRVKIALKSKKQTKEQEEDKKE